MNYRDENVDWMVNAAYLSPWVCMLFWIPPPHAPCQLLFEGCYRALVSYIYSSLALFFLGLSPPQHKKIK